MISALLTAWGVVSRIARLIPWQVWAALGVLVAFWGHGRYVEHATTQRVALEVNATWQKRMATAKANFAAEMDRMRGNVSDLVLAGISERDARDRQLRDVLAQMDQDFVDLKNRRPSYVTSKAIADCTLTRGVVLQFNTGAARANGAPRPASAPEPAPGLVDEPAGIALDRYTGAVEDTQLALGTCRVQVTGWQQHWVGVTAWYDKLRATLNQCFPQEISP